MTKFTRKQSFTKSFALLVTVVLLAIVLALQFVSAPISVPAPKNNANADTMHGVNINYKEAPTGFGDDYSRTDSAVESSASSVATPGADEQISVIISLKGTSMMKYATANGITVGEAYDTAAGKNNLATLESIRSKALNGISKYIIERSYDYNTIMNGVAATVRYGDIAEIEKNDYVESVMISQTYLAPEAVTENYVEVYESGIFDSSKVGYDGTGTVVAVVDTGTDFTHDVFNMELDTATVAMTKDDVAAVASRLTATRLSAAQGESIDEDDLYLRSKLPFAYDYADSDANVYPKEAHGTHVAGIIAGKSDVITGVAPGAQIATFKVFSDYRSGAQTEWILAALEDAVTLGVDAINMSLGTSCGFSREVDETQINKVYDDINAAGICLVVAASNDYSSAQSSTWGNTNLSSNPDSGTVGSPASYTASLAVASVSGVKTKYFMAQGKEIYFAESRLVGKTDPNDFVAGLLGDKAEADFEYVVVPGVGLPVNYTDLDVNGKIAVVRRGSSNFEDKVRVAHDHGAIGVIVYNNVSGTISMSVGTKYLIPSCFVTMDISKEMVESGSGTIHLSKDYLAGPFMSDFSSWGCLPDLRLAPDITAHGGEIYSSVPGGDMYDKLSGTSMAAPNLAGALILVRQYVKEQHPEYTTQQVRDESYARMMSTATTVRNEEGNPYSPRKQGAGLADIANSINTQAYITVDGSNKPKLSLLDDPARTGEYVMNFNVVNTSGSAVSYNINPYVMTESMSSDERTVAEKAYMLDDTTNTYAIANVKAGKATLNGSTLSLSGYGEVAVTVTVKLSDTDKKYLDDTFMNGMFVEGFVKLESNNLDGITLGIPFLAFYGDWSDAPMLDITAYQVGESEADDSVLAEDKLKPDVYGTLPYAGFYSPTSDDGVGYWGMGAFAFIPAAGYDTPSTQEKYAALTTNPDGDYLFYMVSAGLLRGAKRVEMEIRNSATGELIWSGVDYNSRKTHSSGGDQTGGMVAVELNITELDLPNNAKYTFTMECFLDWQGSENEKNKGGDFDAENYTYGNNNKFSFEFTVDNEAPQISDLAVRKVESGSSTRYILDLTAYDNHYLQGFSLLTYERKGLNENKVEDYLNYTSITNGMIPVEGNYNRDTTVSYDLTPYWSTIEKNGYKLYISLYDYAKNGRSYDAEIDATVLKPETDMRITKTRTARDEYSVVPNGQLDLAEYVTVRANSVDTDNEDDKAYIEGYWTEDLVWTSSDETVATVVNGVVTGLSAGETTITIRTSSDIPLDADADAEETYQQILRFKISVSGTPLPTIAITEVKMSSDALMLERGETATISAQILPLNNTVDPKPTLVWSSTSTNVSIVEVSEDTLSVTIKADKSGSATVRATVSGSRISGFTSVRVQEEFEMTNNIYLRSYTGRGGDWVNEKGEVEHNVVEIPDDMGIVYIYPQAFMRNEYIKKVIIPEGVTMIMRAAFFNCTALEEVVLPESLETIEELVFANDNSLRLINLGKVKTIGESAFWGCAMESIDLSSCTYLDKQVFWRCQNLKQLDLSRVGIIGAGAFGLCSGLTTLDIPENTTMAYEPLVYLQTDGTTVDFGGAFAACTGLTNVTIRSKTVGADAFAYCTALRTVSFMNDVDVIGDVAFSRCSALSRVDFYGSVYKIGNLSFTDTGLTSFRLPKGLTILGTQVFEGSNISTITVSSGANLSSVTMNAFRGLSLTRFIVEDGNKYLSTDSNGILYDRAKTKLIAFPRSLNLTNRRFRLPDTVTTIGTGAFSLSANLSTVDLNNVKYIEDSAFTNSSISAVINYDNVVYIGDYAFAGSRIAALPLSDVIEYIGDGAFHLCGNLTGELTIPASLKHIGAYAFEGYVPENITETNKPRSLTSVSFAGSSLDYIGTGAFANCALLTSVDLTDLEVMSDDMFKGCTALETVSIPDGVVSMGSGVFEGCSELVTVAHLSGSLKEVPANTFKGTKLSAISLGENITYIGNRAFEDSLLENINLDRVTGIGAYAFANAKLVTVTANEVESIGAGAFANGSLESARFDKATYIGASAFENGASLSSVTLPSALTIGNKAFAGCTALTAITLESAQTIGASAFDGATALATVELPKAVTIGYTAFNDTAVVTVALPATLQKVTEGAFYGANKLTEITVAAGNKMFVSDNGVLYSINADNYYTLVSYPAGKTEESYSVANRTIKLGELAFGSNKHLKTLTLPAYLQVIGIRAMSGMDSLMTVNMLSADAPTLESRATITYSEKADSTGRYDVEAFTNVYDNFPFSDGGEIPEGFVITVPANNYGYFNNRIWNSYVGSAIKVTDKVHAALATLEYIDRINALASNPTAEGAAAEKNTLLRIYNMLDTLQANIVRGRYSDGADTAGNKIDAEYYTELFGGKDFYSILNGISVSDPNGSASAFDGLDTAVSTGDNAQAGVAVWIALAACIAVIGAAAVALTVVLKRRSR